MLRKDGDNLLICWEFLQSAVFLFHVALSNISHTLNGESSSHTNGICIEFLKFPVGAAKLKSVSISHSRLTNNNSALRFGICVHGYREEW